MVPLHCIFCLRDHSYETVEHIVPHSLGNIHYVLAKGKVCAKCNSRFSKFENSVVSSKPFIRERIKIGLITGESNRKLHEPYQTDLHKFLLKMAFESMYHSRRKWWNDLDHASFRDCLVNGLSYPQYESLHDSLQLSFISIPRFMNKYRLRMNYILLEYAIAPGHEKYFKFRFGNIHCIIRLQ